MPTRSTMPEGRSALPPKGGQPCGSTGVAGEALDRRERVR